MPRLFPQTIRQKFPSSWKCLSLFIFPQQLNIKYTDPSSPCVRRLSGRIQNSKSLQFVYYGTRKVDTDRTCGISRTASTYKYHRYSAYSSVMRTVDLKSAKLSDFCHFLRKKLDFEAFLPKYRDLCYENRKIVPKALKVWPLHACIIALASCKVALMKNGFFGYSPKSAIWRLFSLTKNISFLNFVSSTRLRTRAHP